ncbi:tetratricopeptide repeat protein [Legionella waltersii]|nr:tetratricopeptide repeat protein [Legionella waltersii]
MPSWAYSQSVESPTPYVVGAPAKSSNDIQFDFTAYDEKTYTVAYDVFVMNGKVEDAFQVAKAAVHFNPESIPWREKLAQVASWSGHMQITLEQWLYFYDRAIKVDYYAPNILMLAKQLGNYDAQTHVLQTMLKKHPQNKDIELNYAAALQGQGKPEEALEFLKSALKKKHDEEFMKQYVQVAKNQPDTMAFREALKEWKLKYPHSIEPKLEEAKLNLKEGNLSAAWDEYQAVAAFPGEKKPEFWHEYAGVAMLSGQTNGMIQAYRRLDEQDAIDKGEASNLVLLESSQGDKLAAYQHARRFYFKLNLTEMVPEVINLGSELEKWQDAYTFYNQLKPQQKQQFGKFVENLITLADVYSHVNQYPLAYALWDKILSGFPQTSKIKEGLIWFLVDVNDTKVLKQFLMKWCHDLANKPELWRVYSVALSSLGKYRLALTISLEHYPEIQKDYAALMDLNDLLQKTDQPYWAYIASRNALNQLWSEVKSIPPAKFSMRQLLTWSQLVRKFAPAEMIYQTMLQLQKKIYVSPESTEQMISYALEQDAYSLAGLMMRTMQMQGQRVPEWMQLTLALVENDRVRLLNLVEHNSPQIQHRDRVMAAKRIEEYKKAEELAYQGLAEHPFESEMYELFKDIMLERVNKIIVDTKYFVFNKVVGPLNKIEATYFVTPSLAITGFNTLWLPESNDETQMINPPAQLRTTGIKMKRYLHRSWAELMVGQLNGLGSSGMAGLVYHRMLPKRWEAELEIYYHELANETAPLLVGGMKNTLGLQFDHKFDSYNLFEAQLNAWSFYGQNEQWLGQGAGAQASWRHYFYLSYPDWNTNLYATYRKYKNSNDVLLSPLQTILPEGVEPTSAYYMPVGYTEAAITFGFGQKFREEYTQAWRAFAEAGVSISDAFGLGKILSAGYGGSVFGRDKLLFYGDYADNTRQAGQIIFQVGMRYDYYF